MYISGEKEERKVSDAHLLSLSLSLCIEVRLIPKRTIMVRHSRETVAVNISFLIMN